MNYFFKIVSLITSLTLLSGNVSASTFWSDGFYVCENDDKIVSFEIQDSKVNRIEKFHSFLHHGYITDDNSLDFGFESRPFGMTIFYKSTYQQTVKYSLRFTSSNKAILKRTSYSGSKPVSLTCTRSEASSKTQNTSSEV